MSIIKVKSRIEEYKYRARAKDINELSGRTNRKDLTRFVNNEIVNKISPSKGDVLIDIGCGDGTLLQMALEGGAYCIGILPTNEETCRVTQRFHANSKVKIKQGFVTKTGLKEDIGEKIVCNGVLLLLKFEDVNLALKEIARISKHNALVYIGELPFLDENKNKKYGDSIILWLIWVLKNQGFYQFTTRLRQVLIALISKEPLLITPKGHAWYTPEIFIKKAKQYGLIIKHTFRHKTISTDGKIIESNSRQDYIFTVHVKC